MDQDWWAWWVVTAWPAAICWRKLCGLDSLCIIYLTFLPTLKIPSCLGWTVVGWVVVVVVLFHTPSLPHGGHSLLVPPTPPLPFLFPFPLYPAAPSAPAFSLPSTPLQLSGRDGWQFFHARHRLLSQAISATGNIAAATCSLGMAAPAFCCLLFFACLPTFSKTFPCPQLCLAQLPQHTPGQGQDLFSCMHPCPLPTFYCPLALPLVCNMGPRWIRGRRGWGRGLHACYLPMQGDIHENRQQWNSLGTDSQDLDGHSINGAGQCGWPVACHSSYHNSFHPCIPPSPSSPYLITSASLTLTLSLPLPPPSPPPPPSLHLYHCTCTASFASPRQ